MRKLFTLLGVLLVLAMVLPTSRVFAQKTTVFVVRHAEKDLSNPAERNPPLSAEGTERAAELRKVLEKEDLAAIFSTDFVRTQQTVKPLADANGLIIQTYAPTDFTGLASKIKTEYAGKSVLVAGHSNTVVEIVKALGGSAGMKELTEEDYDYLFKVSITPDGKVETVPSQFGKKTRKG